jgi:hypothetical protein
MSSACVCHIDGEFCFYCEVHSRVTAENERLHAEVERLVAELAAEDTALAEIMSLRVENERLRTALYYESRCSDSIATRGRLKSILEVSANDAQAPR